MDLIKAKTLLHDGGYTCVLVQGDAVFTSRERGVKPLLNWLEEGCVLPGFCAADKVVGKATAFLYCLLGAKAVHAGVMSDAAMGVFREYGIRATCDKQVDYIRNRTNTGMCPMEEATQNIRTPEEAPNAIREKLKQLNS